MQIKKLKYLIFNITIAFLGVIILLLGVSFMLLGKSRSNNNLFSDGKPNNIIALGDYYTLTVVVNEQFDSFVLNDEEVNEGTHNFYYQEGESISFNYTMKDGFSVNSFIAYNSYTNERFDEISNNSFSMPSFNLNLEFEIIESRIIVINKVVYENNNVYNITPERHIVRLNSNAELQISAGINYINYQYNGNYFLSLNNYQNIQLLEETLFISNVQNNDEINVYFIRKYYDCIITCYEEATGITKTAGEFSVKPSDNFFENPSDFYNGGVTCKVFLGADVILTNILPKTGYAFVKVFAFDQNGIDVGYSEIVVNTDSGEITISEISALLNIYVEFIKEFQIVPKVNEVIIDGQNVKMGTIGYVREQQAFEIEPRSYNYGSTVRLATSIDSNNENSIKYEFKGWKLLNNYGVSVDISKYKLTEEDLMSNTITVSNIDCSMQIIAVYGIKNFIVKVVWEGSGSIESNVIGENYSYSVPYGQDIKLEFKPRSVMFSYRDPILIKSQSYSQPNENVVSTTTNDINLKYEIKNIVQNLQVKVVFFKKTWWEYTQTKSLKGKGTKSEPYLVYSADDLAFISKCIYNNTSSSTGCVSYAEAYYVLQNDIDCGNEYYFMPLGIQIDKLNTSSNRPFNGTFDFRYHKITSMFTEEDSSNYGYDGLYDLIGPKAKIINYKRDYKTLIFTLLFGVVGFLIVVRVVLYVEKRRNRPKKVVTLDNYKKRNDIE